MMNETDKQNAHKTMVFIWASLVVSQLMFVAMAYFIVEGLFPPNLSKPLLDENAMMIGLAVIAALLALGLSFYKRAAILRKSIEDQSVALVQQAVITSLALAESVSLVGLFLAFTFHYQYFIIWMIVGIAAALLHFPQRRDIDNATFKTTP